MWARWLHNPFLLGGSQCSIHGVIKADHMLARWLHNPCLLSGGVPSSRQGAKIAA